MFEQSLLIQVGIGVSVHFLLAFPIRSGSFITCTARMKNLNGALRFSHFHVGRIHESFNASQKMIDHLNPGIPAARMPHASTLHEQPPDVSMDPLRTSDLISQQGSQELVMRLNNADAHSSTREVIAQFLHIQFMWCKQSDDACAVKPRWISGAIIRDVSDAFRFWRVWFDY